MYTVVGCSECSALWILDGDPETTRCPRCGTRHRTAGLRSLVETDDPDRARELRARLLAERAGFAEEFSAVDSYPMLEDAVDRPVVDDETYLSGFGIDPSSVDADADRGPKRRSRTETILAGIDELDDPTRAAIVAYAADRGIRGDYTERALDRFVEHGELTQDDGRYRRL